MRPHEIGQPNLTAAKRRVLLFPKPLRDEGLRPLLALLLVRPLCDPSHLGREKTQHRAFF